MSDTDASVFAHAPHIPMFAAVDDPEGPDMGAGRSVEPDATDAADGSESRHARRVMEATSDGVFILNDAGVCEYVNDAGARFLHSTPVDLAGSALHAQIHPGCDRQCPLTEAFNLGVPRVRRDQFKTMRGAWRHVAVRVHPHVDQGQVTSIVVMFTDAAHEHEIDQRRREAFAAHRSAVDGLREVNARQRDFISTVNHELRTPLTSIMGYLDLAMEGDLDGETRDLLDVVNRNAQRLLAQVDDLLLVSRIESGKVTVEHAPVRLADLVAEAVRSIAPVAAERGVTVEVAAGPDNLVVAGDAQQIDRVLLNVLSNAVKFSLPGGRVTVTSHQAGQWAHVQVRDTGVGIPCAEQPRLFEKFFRSTLSQRQEIPGTGLGLTIVRAIVEQHGGQVAIASREGEGTAVAFTLPLATA